MIEINSVTSSVVSPAPAKPAAPATPAVAAPAVPVVSDQQGKVSEEAVRHAVKQANIEFAGSNEKVGFGYEKRLGLLYVQVLDKNTGDVVKEIPSKEFIQHQVFMKELAGMLLDRKA